MLTHVSIKNFAIIENLELELKSGMMVITGETGAGKSIVIDALDIALGDRADSKMIRHGAERYEINLCFDIRQIAGAKQWLEDKELLSGDECIIRRSVNMDSRSRHYINGNPVTLQQLRELGLRLVHIHGQHQHHALLKKEEQRDVLDNYANHQSLKKELLRDYQQWRTIQQEREAVQGHHENFNARLELLRYQVQELAELDLKENELEQLHVEQKKLANAEELVSCCQRCLTLISDDPDQNIQQLIHQAKQSIDEISTLDDKLKTAHHLLNNAGIEIDEACHELNRFMDKVEINPERLETVELRLAAIYQMSRKHHVKAETLNTHFTQLQTELDTLLNSDKALQELDVKQQATLESYTKTASKLSASRKRASKKLSTIISKSMQVLGMAGGVFQVVCNHDEKQTPQAHGFDKVEFLVSANPGQPAKPLAKVASGGELSRVSLAIQVITAQQDGAPTLVFDEVDVGIGGGTAEIVGQLLRELSQTAQVICITHLPQVAVQGHHHLKIDKQTVDKNTASRLHFLSQQQRTQEIARMLGGLEMTENTLAHAEEMLNKVDDNQSKVSLLV